MRFLKHILIGCLAILPGFGQDADPGRKTSAITSFYSAVLSFKEPGVPTRRNLKKLSPLTSKSLQTLLVKASKAEASYERKTKGAVPPLIESYLFFSLFEGATSVGAITPENGGTFLVELSYGEAGKVTNWKDRVFLVREKRRWVVDDIELLGEWDFGDKGRVKDILRSAIQSANETQPE